MSIWYNKVTWSRLQPLTANKLVQSCNLSMYIITLCAALVGEPDKRCDILSSLETLTKNYQTKYIPT